MPAARPAAEPTRQDLPPSPKLSVLDNGPTTFAGRKVGVLVTDGFDAELLAALRQAVKAEGATLTLIAPQVGGVHDQTGALHPADEQLDGAPSVLFDAVALLPSKAGAAMLARMPAARDFVADAAAHLKFIAYAATAMPLFEKAGMADALDAGFVAMHESSDAEAFVRTCRQLRCWDRAGAGDPLDPSE
jgi:catalase